MTPSAVGHGLFAASDSGLASTLSLGPRSTADSVTLIAGLWGMVRGARAEAAIIVSAVVGVLMFGSANVSTRWRAAVWRNFTAGSDSRRPKDTAPVPDAGTGASVSAATGAAR